MYINTDWRTRTKNISINRSLRKSYLVTANMERVYTRIPVSANADRFGKASAKLQCKMFPDFVTAHTMSELWLSYDNTTIK